jgi:hypothetical protein
LLFTVLAEPGTLELAAIAPRQGDADGQLTRS